MHILKPGTRFYLSKYEKKRKGTFLGYFIEKYTIVSEKGQLIECDLYVGPFFKQTRMLDKGLVLDAITSGNY